MTNKKNENENIALDDDPTEDLETLTEEMCAQMESDVVEALRITADFQSQLDLLREREEQQRQHFEVEPELATDTFDNAGLDAELSDAKKTISSLKSEIQSRERAISTLQVELEQLRAVSTGLEKEVKVSEEVTRNLGDELKSTQKKQTNTEELLRMCDREIESMKSQLLGKGQSTVESMREIAAADTGDEPFPSAPASNKTRIEELEQDIRQLREVGTAKKSQRTIVSKITAREDADVEPQPLRMIVARNKGTSDTYTIGLGKLKLGSSPDNDIQISSSFISRHHAQIVNGLTKCVLKDMNSTNGTYVNSKRIKRHALRHGDSIMVGKHRFEYVEQHLDPSKHRAETPGPGHSERELH